MAKSKLNKAERTYFLVNALATEIDMGAKVSKQIKTLVAMLASEHGVCVSPSPHPHVNRH